MPEWPLENLAINYHAKLIKYFLFKNRPDIYSVGSDHTPQKLRAHKVPVCVSSRARLTQRPVRPGPILGAQKMVQLKFSKKNPIPNNI